MPWGPSSNAIVLVNESTALFDAQYEVWSLRAACEFDEDKIRLDTVICSEKLQRFKGQTSDLRTYNCSA